MKCYPLIATAWVFSFQLEFGRYNEIYKETKINGNVQKIEKITTNFAPVLYKVTDEYLQKNNFKVLDLTNREI